MSLRKNEAYWIESRQRWQINVQNDGERKTFTSSVAGRKGKIAAERKADKWLDEHLMDENTKVSILLDQFLDDVKVRCGGESATYRQYEKFIRIYIKPVIGRKRISRVTCGDLQDVINLAYSNGHLSKKTLSSVRSCMMSWLKYCRMHKRTNLFVEGLTIPVGAKERDRTILSPDALRTLLSVSTTTYKGRKCEEPYIWAYRFAVVTGLRPGEVLGLLNENIKNGKYCITQAIDEFGNVTKGKNKNARRSGELGEAAKWILSEQKKMLIEQNMNSRFVFPDKDGNNISQKQYYLHWKRYCAANDIKEGNKPYELRHTFVSVNDEMPEGLKKMVMGHSKSMDTEGVYGHEKQNDKARAAGYIDAAFKPYMVQIK